VRTVLSCGSTQPQHATPPPILPVPRDVGQSGRWASGNTHDVMIYHDNCIGEMAGSGELSWGITDDTIVIVQHRQRGPRGAP